MAHVFFMTAYDGGASGSRRFCRLSGILGSDKPSERLAR